MSEVRQKIDLDLTGTIQGLEKTAHLMESLQSQVQSLQGTSKTVFSNVADVTENYNKSLGDGVKVYGKIEKAAGDHQRTVQKLTGSMQELDTSMNSIGKKGASGLNSTNTAATKLDKSILQLKIKMQAYQNIVEKATDTRIIDKYNRKLQETERQIQQLSNRGKKGFDDMGNSVQKQEGVLQKFGAQLAGVFAIGAVVAWAKQIGTAILDVTAEFQKFEAVLTTSLGSDSAAERAMMMIQDFAAKTPFSVAELTDSYVKLASRGLRPTNKELTALGDIAASTGKSFDMLSEAVLDAMSGENERLKEFGITAKKTGETTQYTFKGVTTEVQNSDEAIKDYLISLGQVEGVTGSMANISETLTGKLSNLGDGLDNLFLTIGQQETGAMSSFITFLSDAVEYSAFLIANTDQLAKKLSAGAVSEFATTTEADFKKLAESTKASGGDVQAALSAQSEAMRIQLEQDLRAAEKVAKEFEGYSSGALGLLTNPLKYNVEKGAEAAAKASAEQLRGQLAALSDAQRFVLDDLKKKEDADAAKREQEAAKRAEEAAKKSAAARLKAQQDLLKALEALEDKAAKAKLDMMDKNSEAYLKALLDNDLQAIAELEKSILQKQAAAGLTAELTLEQQEQIQLLSLEANKRYYDALYKLQQQEREKLLDLQQDSDEKELQQLINKYDAQIREAEEAGQREIALALETAKKRDVGSLTRKQAEKNLDSDEDLAMAWAENTLPDNVSREESERLLQERLLDIQIEFAEKRLALLAGSLDKEDRTKALQLENEIKRLKKGQNEMKENAEKFSLQKLLGLDDEQMAAVTEGANMALGQLQEFLAASVALREKEVQALTQAIDEKGEELDRELELHKQGFASNVETKQQEYDELKAQREKAQKEQQKAQRRQILLDSAMQLSNLITSSTEIYKVLSPLGPFGIGLAVATIATMFGTFLAAKSKAMQATTVPTYGKGGEGSLIKGPSHTQGGIDLVENRSGRKIANIEGGENFYVTSRKATDEFWPLLEQINKGNKLGIIDYVLNDLLQGTNTHFMPNPELPAKLQTLQTGVKTATAKANNDRYLVDMNKHLHTIADNTKPQEQEFETESFRIKKSGNRTRMIRK